MGFSYRRFALLGVALAVLSVTAGRWFEAHAATATNRYGSLESGGLTRKYFVHVPPSYDGKSRLPLVLVLHGATQSAKSIERMSGMSVLADKEAFLAVYPTGMGSVPTWNAGACCGYALEHHIDDVGFLRALIEKLEHDYAIDPRRIFATGISNGGMLSYRLGCEMADKVAAIAPVEGAQDLVCHPSNRVSLIVFHGTADRLVPYEGGSTPFQMGSRRSDTPVSTTVAFWVKENGCSSSPHREKSAEAQVEKYAGCRDGAGVALYAIQGGHHTWPGTPLSRNTVQATSLMWDFFAKHPKP